MQRVDIENRIVEYAPEVDPASLKAHERNARVHPTGQRDALAESLGRVGWLSPVVVNRTTGNILDGHLRVEDAAARGATVPVVYVEVAADDEAFVLATFDPIAALAEWDNALLAGLVDSAAVESTALAGLLTDLVDLSSPADLEPDDDGTFSGSGAMLAGAAALLGAPKHAPEVGQTWSVFGRHFLVIGDVMVDHHVWSPLLTDGTLFLPYPGPYVMQTKRQSDNVFVMVQPDLFIAGMILDAAVATHPELPAPVVVER